jgi:multisubunit Na+/H+ antiporter MnhG subunit
MKLSYVLKLHLVRRRNFMSDILILFLVLLFFLASLGLIRLCQRLMEA